MIKDKPGERTLWETLGWLGQRLSAALIFSIVIIHLLVIHYRTPGAPITFKESVERLDNPLFLSLWVLLLASGLYHAVYGVRAIALDFLPVPVDRTALSWSFFLIGALVFAAGLLFLSSLVMGKPLFWWAG